MTYSFDCKLAEKYGVDEAIFLHNLYFWIVKNEANGRHHHEGRTWTYNSMAAFARLFPFWSKRQVERIIRNLVANGALLEGNLSFDPDVHCDHHDHQHHEGGCGAHGCGGHSCGQH